MILVTFRNLGGVSPIACLVIYLSTEYYSGSTYSRNFSDQYSPDSISHLNKDTFQ